jgi:hypothetical protein
VERPTLKLPIAGDSLTKEAILPERHWGTTFKADRITRAREDLKKNHNVYDTVDWLDEEGVDTWIVDEHSVTGREQVDHSEIGFGREPSSPSGSSNGSVMDTKVGQVIGKAMFTVARKSLSGHKMIQR